MMPIILLICSTLGYSQCPGVDFNQSADYLKNEFYNFNLEYNQTEVKDNSCQEYRLRSFLESLDVIQKSQKIIARSA